MSVSVGPLLFIFQYLIDEFSEHRRAVEVRPVAKDMGMAFRADAKAEGQLVCVGGWECLGGTPPAQARWVFGGADQV